MIVISIIVILVAIVIMCRYCCVSSRRQHGHVIGVPPATTGMTVMSNHQHLTQPPQPIYHPQIPTYPGQPSPYEPNESSTPAVVGMSLETKR